MKYELLSKLYYQDQKKYDKVYNSRFNGYSTIHLPVNIHDNPAFIVPTFELMQLVSNIQKNAININKFVDDLENDIALYIIIDLMSDDIVLSNDIEGVSSTRKEVETAINNQKTNKSVRFKSLVKKYFMMINSDDDFQVNTCEDIRKLYDSVTDGEISEGNLRDGKIFRKEAVSVVSATQKEMHKGVLPEEKIIESMDKALDFLNNNKEVPMLIKVAVFHYYFGYIHPFYDGNGRTSRLISSFKLINEIGLIMSLRLSAAIKNDVNKYYDAFDICNDFRNKGDITPFVYYFLEIINDSIEPLKQKLDIIVAKVNFYSETLNKLDLNENAKSLMMEIIKAKILGIESLNTDELKDKLNLNINTVSKYLKLCYSKGLITRTKNGRYYTYSIDLDMLEQI